MTLQQLLFDPVEFFRTDRGDWLGAGLAVLALSTVSLGSLLVPIVLLAATGADLGFIEAFPTVRYVAGEARVVLDGRSLGAVVVVFLAPALLLGLYALLLHALSWPLADRGTLGETARVVGWGAVPLTGASLLTLGATMLTIPLDFQRVGYAYVTLTGRTIVQRSDPTLLFLVVNVLGLVFVCWMGVVWVVGLAETRGLSRRKAGVLVAVPLALAVANNLGSVLYGL